MFLLKDGVRVLVQTEITQGIEFVGAYVAAILRSFVAAGVFEEILELGEHRAASVLHALVHLESHVGHYQVSLQGFIGIKYFSTKLTVIGALDATIGGCLKLYLLFSSIAKKKKIIFSNEFKVFYLWG